MLTQSQDLAPRSRPCSFAWVASTNGQKGHEPIFTEAEISKSSPAHLSLPINIKGDLKYCCNLNCSLLYVIRRLFWKESFTKVQYSNCSKTMGSLCQVLHWSFTLNGSWEHAFD